MSKVPLYAHAGPASEPRGGNFKGLKDCNLDGKARIWLGLSYMCHTRSKAARATRFPSSVGFTLLLPDF